MMCRERGIPVYAATDPCVSAPAAHRGRGAGGDPPAESAVRARHAEQRPRPQHHRRQGDPRTRAVLQGEGPGWRAETRAAVGA